FPLMTRRTTRHRAVARPCDAPPMSWLGDLGSAFFGALYDFRLAAAAFGVVALVAVGWIARRRQWTSAARRHPRQAAAIVVPLLAVAIPLAWYMASPLVLSSTVDEPAPVAIAPGRLKADRGNQNYPVPAGALDDPSRAASVVIWCKQFSHLFATAPLEAG